MPGLLSDVASKILRDSLHLKKGETITIETWDNGLPLAKEVVKHARKIGGIPLVVLEQEEAYLDGVKNMPPDVLGLMGKHEYAMLAATDAYVFIPGPALGAYYRRITRADHSNATKYNSSWYKAAEKAKLRGVRLSYGYVGEDLAGYLNQRVSAIASAQLKATLADLKNISSSGKAIAAKLKPGAAVTVTTPGGGKLTFKLKGGVVVEDGIVDEADQTKGENMAYLPPGMVTVDVDGTSAEGTVNLSPSLTRLGVAEGITLEFRGGKLVSWKSKKPLPFVEELIKAVPAADRTLSFMTIGLNPKLGYGFAVDRFVAGSIALSGYGILGIVRDGSLKVGSASIVSKGKL